MSEIYSKIKEEITNNKTVLFMKGSKDFPMCGFSAAVVQVLGNLEVDYKDIDILKDEEMRQGIKEFSDWPTIPQLYVNQEFIGGCDIIRDMCESGELEELFKTE